ncbi:MAG: DNA-directed RNA polymerase subunit alpha, partial [Lentisphaeria bacterium]|nr:DNA-directed RNA polymerase subunit alpha [Lentisphaeria bacterium]
MNCLNSADIRLIGELCTKTEQRMLKFRNFGKKSLEEIKEKMEKLNLELGMSFSDAVINALDAKSQQIRAEKEEN